MEEEEKCDRNDYDEAKGLYENVVVGGPAQAAKVDGVEGCPSDSALSFCQNGYQNWSKSPPLTITTRRILSYCEQEQAFQR